MEKTPGGACTASSAMLLLWGHHQHPVSVDMPCHGRESGYRAPPSCRGFIGGRSTYHPCGRGKTRGGWGSADGPRSVDPVAILPLAFCGISML